MASLCANEEMAAGTDFDAGIRTTEPVTLSTRCRTDSSYRITSGCRTVLSACVLEAKDKQKFCWSRRAGRAPRGGIAWQRPYERFDLNIAFRQKQTHRGT